MSPYSESIIEWSGFPALNDKVNVRVPFLCSVNQEWPDDLVNLPGCCFGDLTRPENAERQGGLIFQLRQCKSSVETKHCDPVVPLNVFEGCLKRAVNDHVHFLIFNCAQKDYRTKSSWGNFKKKNNLNNANVVKLCLSADGRLTMQEFASMKWIPWEDCAKLFIVIAVEELAESAKNIAVNRSMHQQESSAAEHIVKKGSLSEKRKVSHVEETDVQDASSPRRVRFLIPTEKELLDASEGKVFNKYNMLM